MSDSAHRVARGGLARFVLTLCLLAVVGGSVAQPAGGLSGREFRLAFPEHIDDTAQAFLRLSSEVAGSAQISVVSLGFLENVNLPAQTAVTVALPAMTAVSEADGVSNRVVRVSADIDVAVIGVSNYLADLGEGPQVISSESFRAVPIPKLGTTHTLSSFQPISGFNNQFLIVSASPLTTTLQITLPVSVGARMAGVPYGVMLAAGEVYSLTAGDDLTGALIQADLPVALIASSVASVGTTSILAGLLMESLEGDNRQGQEYVSVPFHAGTSPDTLRLLSFSNGNNVTVASGNFSIPILNAGDSADADSGAPEFLLSTAPVRATQIGWNLETAFDPGGAGPFAVSLSSKAGWFPFQVLLTAGDGTVFPQNFANLVVPTGVADQVLLDGIAIDAQEFSEFAPGGNPSGFSIATIALAPGSHRVDAPAPFAAYVYGFGPGIGYGHPAVGMLPQAVFADGFEDPPP